MILSDFPMFIGVKWLKYSCNVVTDTTYTQSNISTYVMKKTENTYHMSRYYTNYIFSEKYGFEGRDAQDRYGGQATGCYYVTDTVVWQYANPTYFEDQVGQYTQYTCPRVAEATKHTTTTYSKGGTGYGAVYVDKDDLPEDGQLIEGSADGAYCVIKVGNTTYYYEKGN